MNFSDIFHLILYIPNSVCSTYNAHKTTASELPHGLSLSLKFTVSRTKNALRLMFSSEMHFIYLEFLKFTVENGLT